MTPSPYLLEICRGVKPSGCHLAGPVPAAFLADLTALVEGSPLPAGLAASGRAPRHHECFRLAVCACANGCAKPHVADLGLVVTRDIAVAATACTGCGNCLAACPDRAIARMPGGIAAIDPDRCLGCGRCLEACPEGALSAGPTHFRALLGGRLGRRPRLGLEVGVLLAPEAALALTGRCLAAYGREMAPGRRFADIVRPDGRPGLPAWVLP